MPDPSLEVAGVGLRSLELRNLRVGSEAELAAERLALHYSLSSLRAGRLDELEIGGIRLRASLADEGLSFGSLDVLRAPPDAGAPPVALPVDRVRVEDAAVALAWDDRAVELAGGGEWDGSRARLQLRLSPLALAAGGLAIPLPALDLEAELEPRPESWRVALSARDEPGRLSLDLAGQLDPDARTGTLSLALAPIAFAPGALQPADLLPDLAGAVREVSGTLEARGEFAIGDELGIDLDLVLRGVGFQSELARFDGIDTAVRLVGPSPLRTPPGQLLSVGRVDFGLQLTAGLVKFQLRQDGAIQLEHAKFGFAGGSVATRGRVDLARETRIALDVSGVDLAQLLELVKLEGLSGEGRVSGKLPLVRSPGSLAIRGGRLAATGPGRIRYQPEPAVAGLVRSDPHLELVFAALENFHYQALTLAIEGEPGGEVDLGLHLAGANPDYREGHPFEFNLNLEAHLSDLLRDVSTAYRMHEQVEKRIRAATEAR